MLNLKERRRRMRERLKRLSFIASVGYVASIGTWSGIVKMCEPLEMLKAVLAERGTEMSKGQREIMGGFIQLLDLTHAIGHLAREDWDKASLKDVMGEFKRVMRRQPDEPPA